jgi:hypothetical protein
MWYVIEVAISKEWYAHHNYYGALEPLEIWSSREFAVSFPTF